MNLYRHEADLINVAQEVSSTSSLGELCRAHSADPSQRSALPKA